MKIAKIYNHNKFAGNLVEEIPNNKYSFEYSEDYKGEPISLTMPVSQKKFSFDSFPPFFEGLLPEGMMLENILRTAKIDKDDYMSLLIYCGEDLVGSVTVEASDE